MNQNIVLIGMPTCGKSTVGVILAKAKGYQFIDSDLVIQEQENALLKDIIYCQGIDGFLEIENRVNASLTPERAVIATGGSAIYGKEAMEHLSSIGRIVYIKVSYEEILNRLGDVKERGVVLREGQTLQDLYEERCPLYEYYAHIVVDGETLEIESLVNRILESLDKYN